MDQTLYIYFIPTELLELIDQFINNTDFLELFPSNIKIQLSHIRNLRYKKLFEKEFTGFYKEFIEFLNVIDNNDWETVYKQIDKSIPIIIKEAYPVDRDNGEIIKNGNRSKLTSNHILNSIGLVQFPETLYEVMFYNNYMDMYMKLVNCCKKDLDLQDKSWYYLYGMLMMLMSGTF